MAKKRCVDCKDGDWCWLHRYTKEFKHAERCDKYARKWWKFWRPR